ncbi:MAG: DUF2852 domain-containing protein [Candidatus Competibacteraceae bacterium]|nr:DUF2852 domain-containing protein [Candidatus Competibacteraceae bacterium]
MVAAKPCCFEAKPEVEKAFWVGSILLGFMIWWPFGLAILAYGYWSGKMKCCHSDRADHPHRRGFRMFFHTGDKGCCSPRREESTGNSAFDDYRKETLRRLEEDQREFMEYLERLRRARDRAEFDQFMAERDRRPDSGEPPAAN